MLRIENAQGDGQKSRDRTSIVRLDIRLNVDAFLVHGVEASRRRFRRNVPSMKGLSALLLMCTLYGTAKQECAKAGARQHGAHILKIDSQLLCTRRAALGKRQQHRMTKEREHADNKP